MTDASLPPTAARPPADAVRLLEAARRLSTVVAAELDCASVDALLGDLAALRGEVEALEGRLRESHLSCCTMPSVDGWPELAAALAAMSARRIGCLIAVERTQPLDEWAARGVPLDAALSAPLLQSLFQPGGPVHDGAAIVRKGRLVAAGVFVPVALDLRARRSGGRTLGARHRAALGLSRISDASVFVVSEESGGVSLAFQGFFHFDVSLGLGAPGPEADIVLGAVMAAPSSPDAVPPHVPWWTRVARRMGPGAGARRR